MKGGVVKKQSSDKFDRHGIVKEKTVVKLNAQLVSLAGENGAVMLISAFKSRKSISAPEVAG